MEMFAQYRIAHFLFILKIVEFKTRIGSIIFQSASGITVKDKNMVLGEFSGPFKNILRSSSFNVLVITSFTYAVILAYYASY